MAGDNDRISGPPLDRDRAGHPAGLPGLCAGLCLHPFAGPSGHRANHLAQRHGLRAAGLLVPGNTLIGRGGDHADPGALPLCLPAGPHRLHGPKCDGLSRRAFTGQNPDAGVLAGVAAHGTARDCGRRAADGDGDHRGFRHGVLLLCPDLCDGDLHKLVLHGGPGSRSTAVAGPAGLRVASGLHGAVHPWQRPLRGGQGQDPTGADGFKRHMGMGRGGAVLAARALGRGHPDDCLGRDGHRLRAKPAKCALPEIHLQHRDAGADRRRADSGGGHRAGRVSTQLWRQAVGGLALRGAAGLRGARRGDRRGAAGAVRGF